MKKFSKVLAIALVSSVGLARLPTVDAQDRSPDGIRLDQLARAGSDLSRLHHVDFFLHFPTQKAAERVAVQLISLAFDTRTERGKSGNQWLVVASKKMFPVESDLMGLRDKLNVIAAAEGGVYERWQARVIE